MITEQDLQEAIAECIGERHPNANTCIKLAAYYTIKNNLYPEESEEKYFPVLSSRGYNSYDPPPKTTEEESVVGNYGDSDFLALVEGLSAASVWPIMDELMETVKIINPRLYDGVFRKLNQL